MVAWAAILEANIVGSKHKFQNPDVQAVAPGRSTSLPDAVYDPKQSDLTPVEGLVTTVQKAAYWSPAAERICVPDADLFTIRVAEEELGDIRQVDNVWLGEVCQLTHKLLLGFEQGDRSVIW